MRNVLALSVAMRRLRARQGKSDLLRGGGKAALFLNAAINQSVLPSRQPTWCNNNQSAAAP